MHSQITFRSSLMRLALGLLAMLPLARSPAVAAGSQERSTAYDARTSHAALAPLEMTPVHANALAELRTRIPDLETTWNPLFGTVQSMSSPSGYLTGVAPGTDALATALRFIETNHHSLGLERADLLESEVTDSVFSIVSGATHIYLRQVHRGIPIYGAQLHINVNREGRIISVHNAFVAQLSASVNRREPALSAEQALASTAEWLGVPSNGLSTEPIAAQLMYLPIRGGDLRLVWNSGLIWTADGNHTFEFNVDAETGEIWTQTDSTSDANYLVYERPVESPNHTRPLPPQDARTLAVNPEDNVASPLGWLASESLASLSNNNVSACTDRDANNVCDGVVSCKGTACSFPLDLSRDPLTIGGEAAVTNLFYWSNLIHDIQYQYGFDEFAGNFQQVNFGRGGREGDSVDADAQDGRGICNANFFTPPDGSRPRMQMFLCNVTSPSRDGDFDAGVITHEYGHGISIRQVGGPSNSNCLPATALQQAGEGWSDWFALVYTARAGETGSKPRGVGSYLFGLNPDGGTIRDLPYSTSDAVNNWTYESIIGASRPHGVGSRWAQALWEVYWALVDKWGYEPDLANLDLDDRREAGNKRALLYVNEGLKHTPCNANTGGPSFIDNRNAILKAARENFGGDDVCRIGRAFAKFGLGVDAFTPTPPTQTATNGFIPPFCEVNFAPILAFTIH